MNTFLRRKGSRVRIAPRPPFPSPPNAIYRILLLFLEAALQRVFCNAAFALRLSGRRTRISPSAVRGRDTGWCGHLESASKRPPNFLAKRENGCRQCRILHNVT